jgi:hypothetical protein
VRTPPEAEEWIDDDKSLGQNLHVSRFCCLWELATNVVWGCGRATICEQIWLDVEQIETQRGLQKHVRHFVLAVTTSAPTRGNNAGSMHKKLNCAVTDHQFFFEIGYIPLKKVYHIGLAANDMIQNME